MNLMQLKANNILEISFNLPLRRVEPVEVVLFPKRLLVPVAVLPNKLVVEVGAAVEVLPKENAMPNNEICSFSKTII